MKAVKAKQEVRQLVGVDSDLLNPADVLKLERVQQLKAELKRLEEGLKPRIEATVRHFGAGAVQIGDHRVDLKEACRASVSWKSVAYAVASEAEINAVKDDFEVTSISYSAKVLA